MLLLGATIAIACNLISSKVTATSESNQSRFIKAKGNRLVLGPDEQVIWLRGVNFNNHHWESDATAITHSDHHSEIDYQRITSMGMNVIRFNLNYRVFEDDSVPYQYKQEGWDWLDKNIAWARKYGLYLIMDMHVPQGGYQGGTDWGYALWDEVENQNRLKALWKAIAGRYKDEVAIAAWDLINEPTPSRNDAQWETFAQELIDEIRTVDPNHLLIVEIGYGDNVRWSFFRVDDDNVMYDFHNYSPMEYTHQYSGFVGRGDGGSYPNPDVSVLPNEFVFADVVENPWTPAGDTDWTFFEGNLYKVTDPQVVSGIPTFSCGANQGTVYFDDFVIDEYDQNQELVRRILSVDVETDEERFNPDSIDPYSSLSDRWIPWSDTGDFGRHSIAEIGHAGISSLSITGGTNSYTLSNPNLSFAVRQGYHYQISSWMKGTGVSGESCHTTIEFGKLPPGEEFQPLDKSYLEADLLYWIEFGSKNNVPMNVGEFGLSKWCFTNRKGGIYWVGDMLSLFNKHGIHFQYYDYHSNDLGIYLNSEGPPDPSSANQDLIDLFSRSLHGSAYLQMVSK